MTTLLCWLDAAVRAVDDGVVETAVRLPVETLPQWWRCPRCGARGLGGQVTHCWGDLAKGTDHDLVPVLPDGPFPLRVAVATTEHRERWPGHPEAGRGMGPAIIAVGTITEDGHHADDLACVRQDECPDECPGCYAAAGGIADPCDDDHFCSPHVGPDTWHYALSDVVRFDTPIPAERDDVVARLARHQADPHVHPYTCGNRGDGKHVQGGDRDLGMLTPTPSGWVCGQCAYTQPIRGVGLDSVWQVADADLAAQVRDAQKETAS